MAEGRQVSATTDKDWRVEFEVIEYDHMPSWKVSAEDGYARFNAMMHKKAQWVSLTMVESYERASSKPGERGKTFTVEKQTMMSLNPESAKALYEFLGTIFGGAK